MGSSMEKYDFNSSEEELKRIDERMEKREYDGVRDILKYFDRIHDKLFTFNNILIVGFFTISRIKNGIPIELILFPICNLGFLIFIEYRMMEKSRFDSAVMEKTVNEIEKYGRKISLTNTYSLFSIFTTTAITIFFIYNLFTD